SPPNIKNGQHETLQCPSPPNIDNGNHSSQGLEVFPPGMVVNYSCDPGYSLLGEASIHCTDSGNWSLPPPRCAEVVCPAPQIQNGSVSAPKYRYTYKDTVSFKCHQGFTLRGHGTSQCQANRTWDPPVPVCEQGKCQHLWNSLCRYELITLLISRTRKDDVGPRSFVQEGMYMMPSALWMIWDEASADGWAGLAQGWGSEHSALPQLPKTLPSCL
uniref:Sushi domain-containing protein n=1 Tax=Calidris pygmaea TaxID=425635 RepID=A0A8C3KRH6_9CHAR